MTKPFLVRAAVAWCLLAGASAALQAQYSCSDGTTIFVAGHNIVRASGADVWSYAQTYVTGDYYDYWLPRVTTSMYVNGGVYSGRSNVLATAGYGGTATNQWHDDPRSAGFGSYQTSSTHRVDPDPYYCPYDSPWFYYTGDPATVVKPTIDTLGLTGTWWLGGGSDPDNGLYNAMLLVYSDASNPSPPGTPYWQITDNQEGQATLSCTSCASVNLYSARSTAADGPCNDQGEVKVTVSIGGLASDEAGLIINTPRDLVGIPPDEYDKWPGSDGYETWIHYQTRDRCGNILPSIARNELFPGGWQNAELNNWWKPQAGGAAGYYLQSYNGYPAVWWDKARMTSMGCGGQTCFPVPTNYQGGNELVDGSLQVWYVGSATPGSGVPVGSDVARRYTDHGAHVINP